MKAKFKLVGGALDGTSINVVSSEKGIMHPPTIRIGALCYSYVAHEKGTYFFSLTQHSEADIEKYGPALKWQSSDYPKRFQGRVPKKVRLLISVKPDICLTAKDRTTIAMKSHVYDAWTNSYGAVCAYTDNGQQLGLKPDEFEVVEWFGEETDDVKKT